MPKLLLVVLLSFCATAVAAEDYEAALAKCIADQTEKKTSALQPCAMMEGAERTTCDADVANRFDPARIRDFCAMQSGAYLARDVNTVQESEALARENKDRLKRAGVEEADAAPQRNALLNRPIATKDGKIPLPPSRPTNIVRSGQSTAGGGSRAGTINPDDADSDATTAATKREQPNKPAADAEKKTANNPGGGESRKQSSNGGGGSSGDDSRKQSNNSDSGGDKTGGDTVYNNVSLAQSEAQMDVQSCQSKQNSASLCCNNPLSCASASDRDVMQKLNAGPNDDAGISNYCSQMQGASKASGGINGRLAATCTNNQYACSNSCASLEQKYRGYMANCENCESYSVFMNAASQLANARASCGQLQSKGDQLTAQSLNSASSTAYSQYCQQQAGMSPQSMSPSQAAKTASASAASANNSVCLYNPSAAGCAQANALNALPAQGQGSFSAATNNTNKNNFAVQDLADSGFPGMKIDSGANAAPTVRAIPNGGGGGFGGGGGSPAQLGPSSRGGANRALAAGGGPTTDVDQGFRSGGYTQPAGAAAAYEPSGYDGDRRRVVPVGGLDLKQYLPGGRLAPVRRLAGTNLRSEINAKEEDLFRRISLKMYEKCRLGILYRCD